MAPWVSINGSPNGDVSTCCMATLEHFYVGNLNKQGLNEIWNNEKMRNIRRDMLAGKALKQCESCYMPEKAGAATLRNVLNERFTHHWDIVESTNKDGHVEKVNLPYFDFRFSNICNFRCRTCGTDSSNSWYDDDEKLYGSPKTPHVRPFMGSKNSWNEIEPYLHQIEEIYFAGGEPLISDEHYNILKYLVQNKMFHVRLSYNTNFSIMNYKNQDVMKLWDKFEKVKVGASLDGEGERGQLLRKGQNWNQVVKNRERMFEVCPRVQFYIHPTLNVMNCFHLPDFHKSWVDKGYIQISDLYINLVQHPVHYRIQILPKELKKKLREKYENHIISFIKTFGQEGSHAQSVFEYGIRYMEQEEHQSEIPTFYQLTTKLDEIRNERFFDTFPELKGINDGSYKI